MHILFVCSGNTCRSPLAEAILRARAASWSGEPITVGSAGTGAWAGAPASEGSYLVGLEHGLDLSEHRARPLSEELIQGADLVLAMSRQHLARVQELGGSGKAALLGSYGQRSGAPQDVSDPYGGDLQTYRETYRELEQLIDGLLARLTEGGARDPR